MGERRREARSRNLATPFACGEAWRRRVIGGYGGEAPASPPSIRHSSSKREPLKGGDVHAKPHYLERFLAVLGASSTPASTRRWPSASGSSTSSPS